MKQPIDGNGAQLERRTKLLVGVCSCRRNSRQREAVRETWSQTVPETVRVVFFVGEGTAVCEQDVWQLPCPDTYEALPTKIQTFLRRCLCIPDWEYVFKCDDDTYVVLERLIHLLGAGEFVGSADTAPDGFASGGGGYLLSRECARRVAEAAEPGHGGEDVWVSRLLQRTGVKLVPSTALQMNHRTLPSPDNDLVTAHWCSEDLMRIIHAGATDTEASAVSHLFHAQHAGWAGSVKLLKNGYFLGGASSPNGRWEFAGEENILRLRWFHWPEDRLRQTAFGYGNATLRLNRLSAGSKGANGELAHANGALVPVVHPGEKLHLGAGGNQLIGWSNYDIDMDIRQSLPFPNESIRFLFAEHVVEHVTPEEAWKFFKEARRILKPGGVMRIAVPCVDFIAQRYDTGYAEFLKRAIGSDGSKESAMDSIIGNWGHQAVWTVGALHAVFEALGFRTCEARPGHSNFPELNEIDGHARIIGEHANWVETGVIEAVKDAAYAASPAAFSTRQRGLLLIPRKIHFIWLGSELPEFHRGLVQLCRQLHPDWEIRIWRDSDVRQLIADMQTGLAARFEQPDLSLSTRSDIARYHVVAREGGIYLDADFLLWRTLAPLLEKPYFLVEQEDGHIATCVFGAAPGHSLFEFVLDKLQAADFTESPHRLAGPIMFDAACREWLGASPEEHLLAPTTFFPVDYDRKESVKNWQACDVQPAFGAHLWAHSWGPRGGDSLSDLYARVGALMLKAPLMNK